MLENAACSKVNGSDGETVVPVAGDIDALSAPEFAVVVQGVAITDSR